MSRLQALLDELCPDGVEFQPLKAICFRQKGTPITAGQMKKLNKEDGKIRIFAAGNTVVNVDYGDIPDGDVIETPSIIVKSRGNIGFEYYEKPFSHKSEMWSYSSNSDRICLKFVFYYLQNHTDDFQKKAKTGRLPQISTPDTDDFLIPVPPLPVQAEIVRILDAFTELTDELAEELTLRRKQYAYYRDLLFSFDDADKSDNYNIVIPPPESSEIRVKFVKIAEIAIEIYRGTGITRNQVTDCGVPCVRYGEIYTDYGVWFDKCRSHVDEASVPNGKYFEHGDILFAITGEKIEDIAKSCAYVGHERCLAGGDIVVMKHNQNPKYLSYALSTSNAQQQKSKGKTKSKVVHTSIPALQEIVIPIPPLDEQERIVAMLDRFDALCNDLTAGLPAEIAARRKQYEYYRDKLLSFKELDT